MSAKADKQVVSKKRVTDHGEVYTARREVEAMLDMVKQETERIDSRFLEPACGTGNFLVPILERKLEIIRRRYSKAQLEFERYAVVAVGSIYGVDILEDNVKSCRKRLFEIFNHTYSNLYKKKGKDSVRRIVHFVIERNILLGDALSLKTVGNNKPKPIIFSEWSLVKGSMIKRRDYSFEELIPEKGVNAELFTKEFTSDLGTPVFIPNPIKDFPVMHFSVIHENN